MTEQETIRRLQSGACSSGSVVYHSLQPEVTRVELSDGSVIARLGQSLLGDPLTPAGDLYQFAKALSAELPAVSMFHIEQQTALALQRQGYTIRSLGVESRVALPFSLGGKDKSDLRRALNHSLKAGVVVRELSESKYRKYAPQIAALNRHWLAGRRHFRREFRFLARPLVAPFQPGERRIVAFKDERPVGIAVYDPVYRQGVIIGYFEAIVRCFAMEHGGIRDHLTISALRTFAAERNQVRWVSLGLCPFAPAPRSELERSLLSPTSLALSFFYRFGDRVFNCRGLAFHKARYRGESVPIYFATKSPFPLVEIYRACHLSYIDPLQAIRAETGAFLRRFRRRRVTVPAIARHREAPSFK